MMADKEMLISQSNKTEICALIKSQGSIYKKYQPIHARTATKKERVITVTSSGVETKNTAHPGDFIVKNQTEAGEQYVVKADKFESRYVFLNKIDGLWSEYLPTGQIFALELTAAILSTKSWPDHFYIDTAWGELQYCSKGDFLACPMDEGEFYRIDQKEFEETYTIAEP